MTQTKDGGINRFLSWTALAFLLSFISRPTALAADEPRPGRVAYECKGYLVPASQVTISPKVAGQVVELSFEEGTQVKVGDVLARLDPAEMEAGVRLARAELRLAQAGLEKAKEGANRADIAIAEAKIEVAQAQLVLAQIHLDGTVVRAPIAGIVLAKRAEVGSLINPRALLVSSGLCDLADLKTMEVEVSIPERDVARIALGQACRVQVDAFPKEVYRGSVARLLPTSDRAKAAIGIRVRLELREGDPLLRPEMSAVVQFLGKD